MLFFYLYTQFTITIIISDPQDVPTEILRYDPMMNAYKHSQYLPTKAAIDICYFTLGSGHYTEHYLAIVNQFAFGWYFF